MSNTRKSVRKITVYALKDMHYCYNLEILKLRKIIYKTEGMKNAITNQTKESVDIMVGAAGYSATIRTK